MNKSKLIFLSAPTNTLTAHEYAESCELYQIFSEVTRIVARKPNCAAPTAVAEYLSQCSKGEHVILKSYAAFSKSAVNRRCFLHSFCRIFETDTNVRNGLDYFQLVRLLCSDFPKNIIANAVRLIEGNHERMMEGLMNSERFLNAFFLTFIFDEYLESLLHKVFGGNSEKAVHIKTLFEWIAEEHAKDHRFCERPPIDVLFQVLLNKVTALGDCEVKGVAFVNDENISHFFDETKEISDATITFDALLKDVLESRRFQKSVEESLSIFENSAVWANEAGKLLSAKEPENPQPLNSKKMKKK